MLGQIGLAFGCVNYLTTTERSGGSRQRVHPEEATTSRERLAVPRKASPEDKTPSPGAVDASIQPKISPHLASECTPTTESRTMTLYGYNAAARLPFAFSHGAAAERRAGGERRSLRAARAEAPAGRMVRSASSGAAPHAPPARRVERSHSPGPHRTGSFLPKLIPISFINLKNNKNLTEPMGPRFLNPKYLKMTISSENAA